MNSAVIGKRFDGDQLAQLCARFDVPAAGIARAYDHGPEIIFVGDPAGDHDCDVMGCGQMHVVRRIQK